MSTILEEITEAYASAGVKVGDPIAYGTYYRLVCDGCGKMLGNVGDKLLPGMIKELVDQQFDLYAAGLVGCSCGHQAKITQARDPKRAEAARKRLG